MKWKPIPPLVPILAVAAFLISGPVVVFSFLFGGANAGVAAILGVFFFYIAFYIVLIRRYTE